MHLSGCYLMSGFIIFYFVAGLHDMRYFLRIDPYFSFQKNDCHVFGIFIGRYIKRSTEHFHFQITDLHNEGVFLIMGYFKIGFTIQLHATNFFSEVIQVT